MRTRRPQSSSDPVASGHQPVLLHEVVAQLAISPEATVVDATLGGAGHSKEFAKTLGAKGTLVGFDADKAAIKRAEEALGDAKCKVHLVNRNFREMDEAMEEKEIEKADAFLFDLGWSSFQLAAGRGFSFQSDEPLMMTYVENPTEENVTAREIVNDWAEESIADIIYGWGEERYSRRIAKAIVEARKLEPIETAKQLAQIIYDSVPSGYRHGRTHPATRTFQALRIAVNDEMGSLALGLSAARKRANSGARIAVISFHSIEDRVVKNTFKDWAKEGAGEILTKKPLIPGQEEITNNPRSRSAKLRVFQLS